MGLCGERPFFGILLLIIFSIVISRSSLANVGRPLVFGSYTKGCILGAEKMPSKGEGFMVAEESLSRSYGHPQLVQLLKKLSSDVHKKNLGKLIIGDLSLPFGGPMPQRHASHQLGLDADIWYIRVDGENKGVTASDSPSVIDKNGALSSTLWTSKEETILKMAASRPDVQRIFVNVRIKERLCEQYPDQAWTRKVRSWYGHDDHFHIRLRCPPNSDNCTPQAELPEASGCGDDIYRWYAREAIDLKKKKYVHRVFRGKLPSPCQLVTDASPHKN